MLTAASPDDQDDPADHGLHHPAEQTRGQGEQEYGNALEQAELDRARHDGGNPGEVVIPVQLCRRSHAISVSIGEAQVYRNGWGAAKASGCPRKYYGDIGHRPGKQRLIHPALVLPGGHAAFPAQPGHQHQRPGQRRQRQHIQRQLSSCSPPACVVPPSEQNEGADCSSWTTIRLFRRTQGERQRPVTPAGILLELIDLGQRIERGK